MLRIRECVVGASCECEQSSREANTGRHVESLGSGSVATYITGLFSRVAPSAVLSTLPRAVPDTTSDRCRRLRGHSGRYGCLPRTYALSTVGLFAGLHCASRATNFKAWSVGISLFFVPFYLGARKSRITLQS